MEALSDIAVFVQVVDSGSFTAAAERLDISKSVVSKYVTRLEEGRIVPVGLARQAGFVAAVEADGPWVYLLDRTGAMLRRVPAGEVR